MLMMILSKHNDRKPNPRLVSSSLLSSITVSPDPRLSHMVISLIYPTKISLKYLPKNLPQKSPTKISLKVSLKDLSNISHKNLAHGDFLKRVHIRSQHIWGDAMGSVAWSWHRPLSGSGENIFLKSKYPDKKNWKRWVYFPQILGLD